MHDDAPFNPPQYLPNAVPESSIFEQPDALESEIGYLLSSSQPGDIQALELLIHYYAPHVQRLARMLLSDRDGSLPGQEIVFAVTRDILVEAGNQIAAFRGELSVRTWLFGIALRQIKSWQATMRLPWYKPGRDKPRRVAGNVELDTHPRFLAFVDALPERQRLPFLLRHARDLPREADKPIEGSTHSRLLACVDAMPYRLRLPFLLHYGSELSVGDVALLLNCDREGVSRLLSQGRDRFLSQQGKIHIHKLLNSSLDNILAGDLTAEEQIEKHLADCQICESYADNLRTLVNEVKTALQSRWPLLEPSPLSREALLRAVRTEEKPAVHRRILSGARQAAWVSALLLVFSGIAVMMMRNEAVDVNPIKTPTMTLVPGAPLMEPPTASTDTDTSVEEQISFEPVISGDGRWLIFSSTIALTGEAQSAGDYHLYLVDRQEGTLHRLPIMGVPSDFSWPGYLPTVSDDARWIAYSAQRESESGTACPVDTYLFTQTDAPLEGCRQIFLYDRESGLTEQITQGLGGMPANGHSYSPAISGDGRWLAFWSMASNLVEGDTETCGESDANCVDLFLFDCEQNNLLRVPVGRQYSWEFGILIQPVSISRDGRLMAFPVLAEDRLGQELEFQSPIEAILYDREAGTFVEIDLTQDGKRGDGESFAPVISADGSTVAFASASTNLVPADDNVLVDVFVRALDTNQVELVSINWKGEQGNGESGVISPEMHRNSWGTSMAISTDGQVVAYFSMATNLDVEQEGNCRVSGEAYCYAVYVHDRQSHTTRQVSVIQEPGLHLFLSISGDGEWLSYSRIMSTGDDEGQVIFDVYLYNRGFHWSSNLTGWHGSKDRDRWSLAAVLDVGSRYLRRLAYSPAGSQYAVASGSVPIQIWIVDNGYMSTMFEAKEEDGSITSLTYSPDGRWLACGTQAGSVLIWSILDKRLLYDLGNSPGAVNTVLFSPDGSQFLASTSDMLRIWQIEEAESSYGRVSSTRLLHVAEIIYEPGSVNQVALAPTGNLIALGGNDGTVRLMQIPSGLVVARLGGHQAGVAAVAFSPDGSLLAARSREGVIQIWQVGWRGFGALDVRHNRSLYYDGWLGDLLFSPDGRWLASGTIFQGPRLWDIQSGALMDIGAGVDWSSMIYGLAFDPSGQSLVITDGQQVAVWSSTNSLLRPLFFEIPAAGETVVTNNQLIMPSGDNWYYPLQSLSIFEAARQGTVNLWVPIRLPVGAVFQDAVFTERRGNVVLHYRIQGPGHEANLYILESDVNSASALPVMIGQGATVNGESIGLERAEYVQGDWVTSPFPSTLERTVAWDWNAELPSLRLRWQSGTTLIHIYYQPDDILAGDSLDAVALDSVSGDYTFEDQSAPRGKEEEPAGQSMSFLPTYLFIEDLLQIARSMQAWRSGDPLFYPATASGIYIVQPGDTCSGIASRFGLEISDLARMNDLAPSCELIYAGQPFQIHWSPDFSALIQRDLNCDGEAEGILELPGSTGVLVYALTEMGLYQKVWSFIVDDMATQSVEDLRLVEVGACETFVQFTTQAGESEDSRDVWIYRWVDGEMSLVLSAPGAAEWEAGLDGNNTSLLVVWISSHEGDSSCSRHIARYRWDGAVLINEGEEVVEPVSCVSSP
ncbi:MAG: PD40 domain-containing protein [Anaerolineales bacterium]|nr:PD40 domain-containing protein [Anaerolineales bacterium]